MTARTAWLLLLLALTVSPALGQLLGIGSCPSVSPQANTDASRLLGTWYEYKRYSNAFELGAKCVTASFQLASDNSTIDITASLKNWLTGKETIIEGTAIQFGGVGSGRFTVTAPNINASGAVVVLGTDYDNYAVLWSCREILGILKYKYSWILTRARSPSRQIVNDIKAVLKANRLSSLLYLKTLQSCR